MNDAKKNPAKAVAEAHYVCQHCKKPWNDEDRWRAIGRGEWKPTVKARDPKCASFRLPSWLSTFVTHRYLAAQWIRAQASISSLQDFINGECAEPFVRYENAIRDDRFTQIEGEYNEGQEWAGVEPYSIRVGEVPRIVIGGVDVQRNYLVAAFRCFLDGGESGLVWAGEVANFATLDAQAEKFNAQFIFVDSRYRTQEVNEWCASRTGYIPTLGATRKSSTIFTRNPLNIDEGKRNQAGGRIIEAITFSPDPVKDLLSDIIKTQSKTWLIPRGYAGKKEYTSQMTAEKNVNGRWMPIPSNKPNHFWDAEVLCLLGAIRMQVWRSDYGEIIDNPTPEK